MATVVEVQKMYDGAVTLEYLPNSHTYKVDGDKKIGVTTITGVINKEGLMLWPLSEAMTYLKRNLLGKSGDPAQAMLYSEQEIEDFLKSAEKAYLMKQKRGTDAGTFGHDWLEQYLRAIKEGTQKPERIKKVTVPKLPDWDDDYIRATDHNNIVDAIDEFISWMKNHDVEVIDVERIIYSRKYDYAGRFDAVLRIDGKVYIIDFKTSNPAREFPHGVYPENFAQAGGYDIAYTEEFPDIAIDGHAIFNISKRTGKMTIKYSFDRDINRNFFLYALGTKRGMQHHTRNLSYRYNENKKKEKASA